jgi:pimeloyl-ACP methyl ester carboxylesterase
MADHLSIAGNPRLAGLIAAPSALGSQVSDRFGRLLLAGSALYERASNMAASVVVLPDVRLVEGSGMSARVDGRRVEATRRGLAKAYPAATGRLVVLVHGLADTETAWFHRAEPHKDRSGTDFGSRLVDDLDCSAVYVRYHTGRHISDNGGDLVRLLSDLVRRWPTPVQEIVLIGHSLGGLVVRSAIHQAQHRRVAWLPRVTGVVCLGTPHAGAALERAAAWTAATLGRLAVTAPLSQLLDLRSGAIKDLAHGYLHQYQWSTEVSPLSPKDLVGLTTFPTSVAQLFVYATVSRSPESWWGRLVGDLLVDAASAGSPDYDADLRWLGGLNHIDLLHHDSVYNVLLDWLRPRLR